MFCCFSCSRVFCFVFPRCASPSFFNVVCMRGFVFKWCVYILNVLFTSASDCFPPDFDTTLCCVGIFIFTSLPCYLHLYGGLDVRMTIVFDTQTAGQRSKKKKNNNWFLFFVFLCVRPNDSQRAKWKCREKANIWAPWRPAKSWASWPSSTTVNERPPLKVRKKKEKRNVYFILLFCFFSFSSTNNIDMYANGQTCIYIHISACFFSVFRFWLI